MTTLKALREENKKSRAEVAAALNVSVQAVRNYENGFRQINIDQVLQLSELYEVSAEEVIIAQIKSRRAR